MRKLKQNKKTTIFSMILLFIGCILVIPLNAETQEERPSNYYDENAGSKENPFLIANLANLRWLSNEESIWKKGYYFLQTADIDATETKDWYDGYGFLPIGRDVLHAVNPFIGVYDGGGFTIKNLYVDYLLYIVDISFSLRANLFGRTDNAVIKNVHLLNVVSYHTGLTPFTHGSLVSWAERTTISNCSVTGNIHINDSTRDYRVGGLVGRLVRSTLENSYFYGNIIVDSDNISLGGLVGVQTLSTIRYCYVASNEEFIKLGALVGSILPTTLDSTPIPVLKNNFWDIDTSATLEPFKELLVEDAIIENNYGKTTEEMKKASTFIDNGWDFVNIWDIDSEINDGYPFLRYLQTVFYPPTGLKGIDTEKGVYLSWETPLDNRKTILNNFNIYRDGVLLDSASDAFFIDDLVESDTDYEYFVTAVYIMPLGESEPSNSVYIRTTVSESDIAPILFTELLGNFPNPFNPETIIEFTIAIGSKVEIEIFNIRGQKIQTLLDSYINAGYHQVIWHGTDENGRDVASGIYFYQMRTEGFSEVKRMVLLK